MSVIKRAIRSVRFGTEIRSILNTNENLMYQKVMSCSTNEGKLWSNAVVGLTNKRLIVEWQQVKANNIMISYDQILSWEISNKTKGITGFVVKLLPKDYLFVYVKVNEETDICISAKNKDMEIFINQMRMYCSQQEK